MVKGSALFDTNILIDLFSGRIEAKHALEAYPPQNAISLITWMEVMWALRNIIRKTARELH